MKTTGKKKKFLNLDKKVEDALSAFKETGIDPSTAVSNQLAELKKMSKSQRLSFFSKVGA